MTDPGSAEQLRSSATPPAPVAWPPGYTAAGCLTFDLDAEAAVLTADISSARRMSPMSHQSYGPLVGVPRILDLLARNEIRATFFVPGFSAHRYPDVVRSRRPAMRSLTTATSTRTPWAWTSAPRPT
jgi:peptidoglycan-N-acetylglucosamine deacetylase